MKPKPSFNHESLKPLPPRSCAPTIREAANCRNSKLFSGFTLVELLITIGIIAVLAALILPVLARGKAAAKKIQCIGNARQLGITWMLYSADHNDRLVANGKNAPPNESGPHWVQGGFVYAPYSVDPKYISDPRFALFAPYIRTLKTYICPGDPPTLVVNQQPFPRVRSYELNSYVGWEGPWEERLATEFRVFRKQSQIIPNPAEIFLFQDVNPKSICWPFFGVCMDQDAFFNFPGSSHNRGGVISFADGHVLYHRWTDERTVTAFAVRHHDHHQVSRGNLDLAWLRKHTTVPGPSGYEQP
jgi:prepilin-type N-terminal cleavage/methylation domain-containing protein/prepilin-type processing-associated H-X9-DG protein